MITEILPCTLGYEVAIVPRESHIFCLIGDILGGSSPQILDLKAKNCPHSDTKQDRQDQTTASFVLNFFFPFTKVKMINSKKASDGVLGFWGFGVLGFRV